MSLSQKTPQSMMMSRTSTRMCWPRWKRGCQRFVAVWYLPTTPLPTRPLTPRTSAVCGALAGANGAVGTLQPSYPYIVGHSTPTDTWNCVCLENFTRFCHHLNIVWNKPKPTLALQRDQHLRLSKNRTSVFLSFFFKLCFLGEPRFKKFGCLQ